MLEELSSELAKMDAAGLKRRLKVHEIAAGRSFAANDYLGLAAHPRVRAAAARACIEEAAGSGGSRLVGGTSDSVIALEAELADYFSRTGPAGPAGSGVDAADTRGTADTAALVFSSGYHANLGVITALAGRGDAVFCDRLIHASLIDAVRLSGAKMLRFRHNDASDLSRLLESTVGRRRLIVTEGLFSMDGDIPPLREIFDLAAQGNCQVIVDDAHASGVLGGGKGSIKELGLNDHPLVASGDVVVTSTLSKALGSLGGFVCAHPTVIDYLVNCARPFIFSTALPPAAIAAARSSVSVLSSTEGNDLVARLGRHARMMRAALEQRGIVCMGSKLSPIVPVVAGDPGRTMKFSQMLLDQGFHVGAIRPPAVEAGKCRLRITVSATNSEESIEALAAALASTMMPDASTRTGAPA